jgi:quinol monooxygenase YgiN
MVAGIEGSINERRRYMGDKRITVLARMKAKPDMEEKVKREIMSLVSPTRSEKGCINYDLHQSLENKSHFMLHENWVSKRDLDEHLAMPYLKAFMEKAKKILAEAVEVTLWEKIS